MSILEELDALLDCDMLHHQTALRDSSEFAPATPKAASKPHSSTASIPAIPQWYADGASTDALLGWDVAMALPLPSESSNGGGPCASEDWHGIEDALECHGYSMAAEGHWLDTDANVWLVHTIYIKLMHIIAGLYQRTSGTSA